MYTSEDDVYSRLFASKIVTENCVLVGCVKIYNTKVDCMQSGHVGPRRRRRESAKAPTVLGLGEGAEGRRGLRESAKAPTVLGLGEGAEGVGSAKAPTVLGEDRGIKQRWYSSDI